MTAPAVPDWTGRLRTLQHQLASLDVDALVVSELTNIRYLCGFAGTAGLLLATRADAVLVTDGRYTLAARQGMTEGRIAAIATETVAARYDLTLGALVARLGLRRIAFEAGHVTVATLRAWERAAPGVAWAATERLVEGQRLIKDAGEIQVLRRGGTRIAAAIAELGHIVSAGKSEREVAKAIDALLDRLGFSAPAFPTIVASGPNSALPHARPTDRRIGPGDLVMLDFGGVLDGYCVDVTRMAAVRPLADRASSLFSAVKVAQEAAIQATRPGIPASDVDAAARSVLEAKGLGSAFTHSTGHGLGLEVHEAPRIGRPGPDAPERIAAGMVFTVEPGAYLEGFGGVRVEDDLLVTAEGREVLTDAPRDLIVV